MSINSDIINVPYNRVFATMAMRGAPRFGRTDDFSILGSGDRSDATDYAVGLIFISAFCVAVSLLWMIILLIFKCLGKKVGFLSGRPFQSKKRGNVIRPFFCLAIVIFIVFTILVVLNGLRNVQDTVQTVSDTNQDVESVLVDADGIATSLQNLGESTTQIRDTLVRNLGNFCPGDSNLDIETGFDFDALAGAAIEQLNVLGDFITNDVAEVRMGIQQALDVTADVDSVINRIDVNDWQSIIILIPYILVPSFLLVGCIMAWCRIANSCSRIYQCICQWFFLPLLILIVIVALLSAAATALLAVANADFCSGNAVVPNLPDFVNSPDGTVLSIIERQRDNLGDDIVYTSILYYISQCRSEDPFTFIAEYEEEIAGASTQVAELDLALQTVTVPRLNLLCGKDFGPFEGLIDVMQENLEILSNQAKAARALLSCQRITPIYTNAVYDGTCRHSVNGATWAFACNLILVIMGLLMIMFRSSLYANKEEEDALGESVDRYAQGEVASNEESYYHDSGFVKQAETYESQEYLRENTGSSSYEASVGKEPPPPQAFNHNDGNGDHKPDPTAPLETISLH